METIGNLAQVYLTIGALLMVAIYGMSKRWPSPIEVVVSLLFWPGAVWVAIKQAGAQASGKAKDKDA